MGLITLSSSITRAGTAEPFRKQAAPQGFSQLVRVGQAEPVGHQMSSMVLMKLWTSWILGLRFQGELIKSRTRSRVTCAIWSEVSQDVLG